MNTYLKINETLSLEYNYSAHQEAPLQVHFGSRLCGPHILVACVANFLAVSHDSRKQAGFREVALLTSSCWTDVSGFMR